MLGVRVAGVDHVGGNHERVEGRRRGVVGTVANAVDVQSCGPIGSRIDGADVEHETDVAAVLRVGEAMDVLVGIHQPRIVRAVDEAGVCAADGDRDRIGQLEDRQVRRVQHEVVVAAPDPLGAAPCRRRGGGVHQPGLEPRRRLQAAAIAGPRGGGPCVPCRRAQWRACVGDAERAAVLAASAVPRHRPRGIADLDAIGGLRHRALSRVRHSCAS